MKIRTRQAIRRFRFDSARLVLLNCNPGQLRDGTTGRCGPGIGVNIPRERMPQIPASELGNLREWLRDKNVSLTDGWQPASELKPAQSGFKQERVDAISDADALFQPSIVSQDDYILDGTHRWVKHWQRSPDALVPVLTVGLDLEPALELLRAFPGAKFVANQREVPVVLQRDSVSCGAACLAAIAQYFGIDATKSQMAKDIGTTADGTSTAQLVQGAFDLGLFAKVVYAFGGTTNSNPEGHNQYTGKGFLGKQETARQHLEITGSGEGLKDERRIFVTGIKKDSEKTWLDHGEAKTVETTFDLDHDAKTAYLGRIDALSKGKGYAREAAKHVMGMLADRGFKSMSAYVQFTDPDSQSMMQKLGGEPGKETDAGRYWHFDLKPTTNISTIPVPFIASTTTEEGVEHWVVVTELGESVSFMDPAVGQRTLSADEFHAMWHDRSARGLAVVVTGKVENSNPEGCNQFTGPGCSTQGGNAVSPNNEDHLEHEAAAASELLGKFAKDGNEHAILLRPNGERVGAFSGDDGAVDPYAAGFGEVLRTPGNDLHFHHNHPVEAPLSPGDIMSLSSQSGVHTLYAHTPGGMTYAASVIPGKGAELHDRAKELFTNLHEKLKDAWLEKVDYAPTAKDRAEFKESLHEAQKGVNRQLASEGLMTYREYKTPKPTANANPDGCNQFTGPGCSIVADSIHSEIRTEGNKHTITVKSGNQKIGLIHFRVYGDGTAGVEGQAVMWPDFRGKGLSHFLYQEGMKHAKALGATVWESAHGRVSQTDSNYKRLGAEFIPDISDAVYKSMGGDPKEPRAGVYRIPLSGDKPTANRSREQATANSANLLKRDPTRTLAMRNAFAAVLKKQFAQLKTKLTALVVGENAFGLTINTENQPRDEIGRWSSSNGKVAGHVETAHGKIAVTYDNEVTSPEEAGRFIKWLSQIPKSEMVKSVAKRIEVFSDSDAMRSRMDEVGIDPEIGDSGEVRGAFDFSTGTLYASSWNGYEHSPHNLLHEFGHSVTGYEEEPAESWANAHSQSIGNSQGVANESVHQGGGWSAVHGSRGSGVERSAAGTYVGGGDRRGNGNQGRDGVHRRLSTVPGSGQSQGVNNRFEFKTDPDKLKSFQEWLAQQFGANLKGATQEELWKKYIQQGFARGAGRAFDDVKKPQAKHLQTKKYIDAKGKTRSVTGISDFYKGSKDEFLRSSFAQPETREKVELLASRAFDELKDVTAEMSNRMSRVLSDALIEGKNPRAVARELSDQADISYQRAKVIARTELSRAHSQGQLNAFKALGVTKLGVAIEFEVGPEPCAKCNELDGKVFNVDDANGIIPVHPNCVCCFLPSFDTPDADKDDADAIIDNERKGGYYFTNCPRDEHGYCLPADGVKVATKEELDAARKVALRKAKTVPKPTPEELQEAQEGIARLGANKYRRNLVGNTKDRAKRRQKLLDEFGDGKQCPCVYCGLKLEAGTLEQDKIVTTAKGGRYRTPNLIPACSSCNKSRGDLPFSKIKFGEPVEPVKENE